MTEIQDWHRPTPQRQDRQAEARWGPRERTPRPAANSRAAPETRITPPGTIGKDGRPPMRAREPGVARQTPALHKRAAAR